MEFEDYLRRGVLLEGCWCHFGDCIKPKINSNLFLGYTFGLEAVKLTYGQLSKKILACLVLRISGINYQTDPKMNFPPKLKNSSWKQLFPNIQVKTITENQILKIFMHFLTRLKPSKVSQNLYFTQVCYVLKLWTAWAGSKNI